MQGLEIILQCLILIEGGPGCPLTRVTGPDMGEDVNRQGHFGHDADVGRRGHSIVAPLRCTGGGVAPW